MLENPTTEELRRIADRYHLTVTDDDLRAMSHVIADSLASHRRLDELDDDCPTDVGGRSAGAAPTPEENPHNAWVWRSRIDGSGEGPLAGRSVAFKDNVAVAGLPMKVGTDLLDGFVPDEDATIVTRALDAGATVLGKAACEYMSFSGSSYTAATGAVLNPHDPTRTSGGSSSGSGALVASGAVDIANGGDQAGSIRIPASFCGVYGLKPSYGLVPATGVVPIELSVDHVGALAATVADIAAFLDAVAGEDTADPRQRMGWGEVELPSFAASLTGDVRGLKVGIVTEGFGWDVSEADVDAAVEEAAQQFSGLGASVDRTSIPLHRDGAHINGAILMEGSLNTMLRGNGAGTNWKGRYPRKLMEALGAAKLEHVDQMSDMMKELILLGEYLQEKYHGRYYAKAQNLALQLTAAYDRAFTEYDILVMPSTPMKATVLPTPDMTREERFTLLLNMIGNTGPTCVTGHPAMSVPCARSQGLPVGMMLVGRQWEDTTVLRASHAFEQTGTYGDVVVGTSVTAAG